MIYDVDYFIRKYSNTRDEMWCVGDFNFEGKTCANGWLGVRLSDNGTEVEIGNHGEVLALKKIFSVLPFQKNLRKEHSYYSEKAAIINDGQDSRYQQSTPKQRILAALHDIKKMQDGQATMPATRPETKVITKYVSVPETIKEQSSELILS